MNRRKMLSMLGLAGLFPRVALGKESHVSNEIDQSVKGKQKKRKSHPLVVCSDGSVIWREEREGIAYHLFVVRNGESKCVAYCNDPFDGVYLRVSPEEDQFAFCLATQMQFYDVETKGPFNYERIIGAITRSQKKWNESPPRYFVTGWAGWATAVDKSLREEGLSRWEARIASGYVRDSHYFRDSGWNQFYKKPFDLAAEKKRLADYAEGRFPKMKIIKPV